MRQRGMLPNTSRSLLQSCPFLFLFFFFFFPFHSTLRVDLLDGFLFFHRNLGQMADE